MEQKRFVLAMVLSGLVLLLWQLFLAPEPPEVTPEEQAQQVSAEQSAKQANKANDQAAKPGDQQPDIQADDAQPAQPVVKHEERRDVLLTPNFRVELTNKNAAVHSVSIIEPTQYSKRGNLLDAFPEDAAHYPFSIQLLDSPILNIPDNTVFEFVEDASTPLATGDYSKITYRYSDPANRFHIDKVFSVNPEKTFMVELDVKIVSRHRDPMGARVALDVYGMTKPGVKKNFLDFRPDELQGVCRFDKDTKRLLFQKAEKDSAMFTGQVFWGGADTRYFLMAGVPLESAQRCEITRVDTDFLRTRIVGDSLTVAPNTTASLQYLLYMGPKDYDVLTDSGHRLEDSVDFGLLTVLARPLRWLLVLLNSFVGNWGVAIIFLTLLIKLVTWPITDKAYVNTERMKLIQPKIKELNEKYEKDPQRKTEETMKLFKENKVNPLGCLPMLIQMPVLYGLFVMIYNSVELYHANFALWYTDLSAPDPYFVLPILMGAIMVVQQRMTPMDAGNKQMATMMKVMPIVFTAFMLFLPSGLVLYYFVNLVLGVGQQYLIKRRFANATPAA